MGSSLQYLQNVIGSSLQYLQNVMGSSLQYLQIVMGSSLHYLQNIMGSSLEYIQNLMGKITAKIEFELQFVLLLDESLRRESLPVIVYYDEKQQGQQQKERKKKKPFYLPHCLLYPTWILCILVILGCGFMVVWYGMAFGNKKSLDWLASVTICLVRFFLLLYDTALFQPIIM